MSIRVSSQLRSTLRTFLAVALLSAAVGFVVNAVGCSSSNNNPADGAAGHAGGDGSAGHDGAAGTDGAAGSDAAADGV